MVVMVVFVMMVAVLEVVLVVEMRGLLSYWLVSNGGWSSWYEWLLTVVVAHRS